MVPLFLHQAKKIKSAQSLQKSRTTGRTFITFTGISFHPYLSRYISKLRKAGIDMEAVPIGNTFFGTSVTVTGLLTGRDVIKSLSGLVDKGDTILIPDVVLRSDGDIFLDDISLRDIEEVLGVPAVVVEATPSIVEAIAGLLT